MRKIKHAVITIVAMFAIVGCAIGIRNIGLHEAEKLKAKRQAEIIAFWNNYSNIKSENNTLAKSIKEDFVNRMSQEMNMDELLSLVNETLENPITLEELISD